VNSRNGFHHHSGFFLAYSTLFSSKLFVINEKPEMVMEAMREFTKDRYGVDIMKVEVPICHAVCGRHEELQGTKAYSKQEAKDLFQKASAVATKPFIYLSAGVKQCGEFSRNAGMAPNLA